MGKNAVEEFLAMKKTAGPWTGFGEHLQHAAAGGLATAAVGVGLAGVGAAAGKIMDAATKSRDFKSMLEANGDLQEHYHADPKRFNMMFSTLRTMNPEFSKDPLVAGAFMRQMHESPTGIAGIAGEALRHRGDFGTPFSENLSAFGREGAKSGITHALGHPEKDRAHEQRERHHDQNLNEQLRQSQLEMHTEKEKNDKGFWSPAERTRQYRK